MLGTTVSPIIPVALGTPTSPGVLLCFLAAITDLDAVVRRGGCEEPAPADGERLDPSGCCSPGQVQGAPASAVGRGAGRQPWLGAGALPVSVTGQREEAPMSASRGAEHPLPYLIVKAGMKHGRKCSGFGNQGLQSSAFTVFPQALHCLPALRQA